MKTQINEELNLIKYLFNYEKGKVISEQNNILLTETDGKTKEEYPDCVRQFGEPTAGGGNLYSINGTGDFTGYRFFNNNRVQTPDTSMVNYFCTAEGSPKIGKPDQKELLLINTKKCGWGNDIKGYEASGWKCDSKMSSKSALSSTAENIQKKLKELKKDIGPRGVDGKIGPETMKAIWDVIKYVK